LSLNLYHLLLFLIFILKGILLSIYQLGKIRWQKIEQTSHIQEPYPFEVVYLNLDRNKNRAEHMEKILDFVGLKHRRRIRAVDSKELYKDAAYLNEFEQSKDMKLNFEEQTNISVEGAPHRTANWLSFLFLFKDLGSLSSSRPFLIFEDDVDLKVDFAPRLINSMRVAPVDWEILLCGHAHHRKKKNKYIPEPSRSFWKPTEFFVCLHCFVVRNSSVATRIANELNMPLFTSATDLVISGLIQSLNMSVYAAKDPMAMQRRDLFVSNTKDPGLIPRFKLSNSAFDLMKNKS
jgi:hypothetical protein